MTLNPDDVPEMAGSCFRSLAEDIDRKSFGHYGAPRALRDAANTIEAQAAEISRLRDALRAALPAIDGYVDRCDFTKGNAIREIARTALEANHGRS